MKLTHYKKTSLKYLAVCLLTFCFTAQAQMKIEVKGNGGVWHFIIDRDSFVFSNIHNGSLIVFTKTSSRIVF